MRISNCKLQISNFKSGFTTFMKTERGFTIIELIIAMAILGILSSLIIVTINPVQMQAQGRDSGRKNTINQLSLALESFHIKHNLQWPVADNTWVSILHSAREIKNPPPLIEAVASGFNYCTPNRQNGYCYAIILHDTDGDGTGDKEEALLFTRLEADDEKRMCPDPSQEDPFYTWSSVQGKTGLVCAAGNTIPNTAVQTFRY